MELRKAPMGWKEKIVPTTNLLNPYE